MDERTEQWLVGFWEGDGMCGAYLDVLGYLIPRVIVTQKDRAVLEHVRDLLTFGSISEQTNSYNLTISSWKRCARVFELLCKHVVGQQSVNKINRVFGKSGLSMRAQCHKPVIPWTVGFFDAEGNIDWCSDYDGLKAFFSQKDKAVLESVQSLIGGHLSSVREWHNLRLSADELRDFLPQVLEYSHHELRKQNLLTKIHVLAQNGKGVWNNWAHDLIEQRR